MQESVLGLVDETDGKFEEDEIPFEPRLARGRSEEEENTIRLCQRIRSMERQACTSSPIRAEQMPGMMSAEKQPRIIDFSEPYGLFQLRQERPSLMELEEEMKEESRERAFTLDSPEMMAMDDMVWAEEEYPPKTVHEDYLVDTMKSDGDRPMKEVEWSPDKNDGCDPVESSSAYPFSSQPNCNVEGGGEPYSGPNLITFPTYTERIPAPF